MTDHLTQLPSGQAHQWLGWIPLVLSMPVLVSQNFDVEGGVVNGSRGTVTHIHYYIDENNHHYLQLVVVHIPNSTDKKYGSLTTTWLANFTWHHQYHFRTSLFKQKMTYPTHPSSNLTCICHDRTLSPRTNTRQSNHWSPIVQRNRGTLHYGIPCMVLEWFADFMTIWKEKNLVQRIRRCSKRKAMLKNP